MRLTTQTTGRNFGRVIALLKKLSWFLKMAVINIWIKGSSKKQKNIYQLTVDVVKIASLYTDTN